MLHLNKQNAQFIIAQNSYLTAVLLIPKCLKFHSSYFRVKLIQVRQTLHTHLTGDISSHLIVILIRGRVAGGAAQAGGPRLQFPGHIDQL